MTAENLDFRAVVSPGSRRLSHEDGDCNREWQKRPVASMRELVTSALLDMTASPFYPVRSGAHLTEGTIPTWRDEEKVTDPGGVFEAERTPLKTDILHGASFGSLRLGSTPRRGCCDQRRVDEPTWCDCGNEIGRRHHPKRIYKYGGTWSSKRLLMAPHTLLTSCNCAARNKQRARRLPPR